MGIPQKLVNKVYELQCWSKGQYIEHINTNVKTNGFVPWKCYYSYIAPWPKILGHVNPSTAA